MNKRLITLLTSAVFAITLSSCDKKIDDPEYVTELTTTVIPGSGYTDCDYFNCDENCYVLSVGETTDLKVTSFPAYYASNSLTFTSTNTSVCTVSESGEITGKANGQADIKIESKDGSISTIVRVVVGTKSTKENATSTINAIKGIYSDSSHVKPGKVIRYESSHELYKHEGEIDHGFESYEVMAYDTESGYFYIEGPSLTHRVKQGVPEIANGKWLFYPINDGQMTRLVHITPLVKNYFDINTAIYETNDKIIRDILNFFFVDGEDILDNLLDAYDGGEDFDEFTGLSKTEYYQVTSNSLLLDYSESGSNQKVSADDELNYYDIPADTVYSYVYNQKILNNGGHVDFSDITMTMSYKLFGENWERSFARHQVFGNDFQIEKIQNPKDNGYKLVDTLYDL